MNMNIIKVNVNFKNRTITKQGVDLTEGDYNSTKMVFTFDREDGTKVLEMKNPNDEIVLHAEIENNEVVLVGYADVTTTVEDVTYIKYTDENENTYWYDEESEKLYDSEFVEVQNVTIDELIKVTTEASIFNEVGNYTYEVVLYDGDSKLTSASDYIKIKKKQIDTDGETAVIYKPVFDEMMGDLNEALDEVDNLDIGISKSGSVATVTITRKDGTTESKTISDGTNGTNGTNGQDGFSPIATVTQTQSGATISITDKNGTTTANVTNGQDGEEYDDTEIRGLIAEKQDELVSGTNIKTINNTSILGSGNIDIQGGGTSDYSDLTNKPSINNVTLSGNKTSSNLGLQDILVSGTNIKTINNTSLLGNGNIDIQGGSDTVTINYDDTDEEIIQKLESIFDENGNIVKNAVFYLESNLYFLVQGGIQSGKTIGVFSQVYPGLNEYLESEKTWYECFALSVENNELSMERSITQLADRDYIGNKEDLTINEEYAATHPGVYDRYNFRYAIDLNYSLAKGTQKAISFSDYQTMITRFNTLGKDYYNVGQSVYIVTLNVPDLWVSGMAESRSTYTYVDDATFINTLQTNGYVQVGYYRFSMVESKKTNSPDIHIGSDAPIDDSTIWVDTDEPEPTIPTKTSQLSNDSDFVNSEVNTLQNYYNKMSMDKMIEDIWDMLGGSLPAGYTKVEYLQGSGNQYIDLGFVPHTGIVAKGKYTGFTQPMPLGIATPMGVMSSSSNRFDMFSFGTTSINSVMTPVFGLGYVSYHFTSTPITQGQVYEVESALKNGEQYLKVDGTTIFTNNVSGSIEATANMLMFNRYKNGALDTGWYEGKIYYTKIWQDNVLIRDMIPCLDNNGTPCFYDRVNKETYYNQGTGEFIYGPVEIPSSYTRCKYLESSGTQYIDTGVIATVNTGISIDYSYNQIDSSTNAGMCGIYQGTNPRTDTLFITTNSGKTDSAVYLFDRGATLNTNKVLEANTMYNAKTNWLNSNKLNFENGTNTADVGTNGVVSRNIILFGRDSGGNYALTKARIYSCKFSENNIITHDLIPCLDSTNTPCFYDAITKQTYYNAGTGTFTYEAL